MKHIISTFFLTLSALVMLSNAVYAQDENPLQNDQTAEYNKPYCQFSISFPEKPEIKRICEGTDSTTCYDKISYTKVFDLAATVRFDVICNPSNEKLYNHLNPDEMRMTVRKMSQDSVMEAFEIDVREEENYRHASLVGRGQAGMDDSILLAQLWSAKNSMMSVEAELSGPQMDEADQLFAQVLRSISFVDKSSTETDQEETPEAEDAKE